MSTVVSWSKQPGLIYEDRKITWWADCVGAIATVFSVTAAIINLVFWATEGMRDWWLVAWLVPLIWSGLIEVGAITAVFLTDSDTLRAIGGFSMVGVNATSAILINLAEAYGGHSEAYIPTFALHAVAFGQALGTFIGTFILNGDGYFREYFNFYNCGEDATLFEGNCW